MAQAYTTKDKKKTLLAPWMESTSDAAIFLPASIMDNDSLIELESNAEVLIITTHSSTLSLSLFIDICFLIKRKRTRLERYCLRGGILLNC